VIEPRAAEEVLSFVIRKFLKGGDKELFFDRMRRCNMLPLEEQSNAFFKVYEDFEKFIINKKILSVEELRQKVRDKINIHELEARFRFLFLTNEEQLILLVEFFFNKFIENSGMSALIDILNFKVNLANHLRVLKNSINANGTFSMSKIIQNLKSVKPENRMNVLSSALSEFINAGFYKAIELFNKSKAEEALREAYELLQLRYGFHASKVYSLLPIEILSEDEKYNILKDSFKELADGIIEQVSASRLKRFFLREYRRVNDKISSFRGGQKEILLQNSFAQFFDVVNKKLELQLGKEETERIFENAYARVKSKFGAFPIFMQILKSVPRGILEIERFNILSKEELEKITKALKKTDAIKSEFTNIAAHELRTPLIPIMGFLKLMAQHPKKYGLNNKGREYVSTCLRNAERLNKLIGDILDISKLEAGEMKFEMERVNINSLLNDVVTDFLPLIKKKKLVLKVVSPKTLPLVEGDRVRLMQVLSNLVDNAIKFTDKGSITITVKVVGKFIQVSVADTGVGLRKKDIQNLFTKFYQAQDIKVRKTKGTGLGLAICKEIILAHDGKIWVESKGIGKGTTVSFLLPVKS